MRFSYTRRANRDDSLACVLFQEYLAALAHRQHVGAAGAAWSDGSRWPGAFGGTVWIPLGQVLGWVAWLFLAWTTRRHRGNVQDPEHCFAAENVSAGWVVGYYAVLAAATWWPSAGGGRRLACAR